MSTQSEGKAVWPSAELEAEMLADADRVNRGLFVFNCACHIKALLARVRELEREQAGLGKANASLLVACKMVYHDGSSLVLTSGENEVLKVAIEEAERSK